MLWYVIITWLNILSIKAVKKCLTVRKGKLCFVFTSSNNVICVFLNKMVFEEMTVYAWEMAGAWHRGQKTHNSDAVFITIAPGKNAFEPLNLLSRGHQLSSRIIWTFTIHLQGFIHRNCNWKQQSIQTNGIKTFQKR